MANSTALTAVSTADWEKLASGAEVSPAELQSKYEAAVASAAGVHRVTASSADAEAAADCIGKTFGIDLLGVIGIDGSVQFCGSGSNDWSATLDVELKVAGVSVWHTTYTLSPTNASVCFSPDVGVAKAEICIGIVGSNHCFNIHGSACYWSWTWHCADFNETLFCFG